MVAEAQASPWTISNTPIETKAFNRRERRVRRENSFSKSSANSALSAVK